jgi:hypothetical protein
MVTDCRIPGDKLVKVKTVGHILWVYGAPDV